MADNLPTDLLPPTLRAPFVSEILPACSVGEARRLSSLPVPRARQEILAKIASLGTTLTRPECDRVLQDLALILPRANLDLDQVDRMLDLYFGLLREAGVTQPMLTKAAQAFVMAPKKGKPRFFPDPGELAEMVADQARDRKRSLSAFRRSLDILSGNGAGPERGEAVAFDAGARLKALGERMRVGRS